MKHQSIVSLSTYIHVVFRIATAVYIYACVCVRVYIIVTTSIITCHESKKPRGHLHRRHSINSKPHNDGQ